LGQSGLQSLCCAAMAAKSLSVFHCLHLMLVLLLLQGMLLLFFKLTSIMMVQRFAFIVIYLYFIV